MNEKTLLEEYFGKQIQQYISEHPERLQELITRFKAFQFSEEWRILKKVIEDTRERVLQNMYSSPVDLGTLLAYRESLSALDFLKNLPENLLKVLELELPTEENL